MGRMTDTRHLIPRVAFALLACTWLVATPAFAQDPRAAIVQNAAREWLLLVDRLDAAATWKSAGPRFQQALTVGRWAEGLAREREPRGATVRRAVTATSFGTAFAGLPEGGNYVLVKFRSSFAQRPDGEEHVTLELGADETWRVIGYVIL
jgi:hypothetical protein